MGRRKKKGQLTPLELEIMKVLWASGPATVQSVQERLPGESLAYTTVQTMLNVLHRKGKVRRALRGRAYQYSAALTRDKAIGAAIRDVVDRLFGGSAESLVMSLIQRRDIQPEKLEQLSALIEQQREPRAKKEIKDGNA